MNLNRWAPRLILSILGLTVCATCETNPQFSLNSLDSAGFTHDGSTYAVQLDDAGNLVVTMEDGTSFTVDPNGDVTQAISEAGAKLDLQYDGNNINANTYFPEFDDSTPPRLLMKDLTVAQTTGSTVCDEIQEGCEVLTIFVDVILPELEPLIVASYHDK
ncbi:MAG TPA: hypothetical protein VNT79_11655, partial [Phycisphaerae bacterium]|nr:hypothetical protein [Phycisphaerae bacterium]